MKKVVVKYDELGKPIELVDVKEFVDPSSLKDFQLECEKNKLAYEQRLNEKAEKELIEKAKLYGEITNLKLEILLLKSVISHILGIAELTEEEINRILGVE